MNDIIIAIGTTLYDTFGKGYGYYNEKSEQRFKPPCFFVELLAAEVIPCIGNRYFAKNSFLVHFYSGVEKPREDFLATGERMFEALQFIKLSDGTLQQGYNQGMEIKERELIFTSEYNYYFRKVGETPEKMSKSTITVKSIRS